MDRRDEDQEDRIVEFERLNLLGKTVFFTGAAARFTADVLEKAIDRAADIVVESERAFREGRDPNVDDAKILDEYRSGDPPRER